MNFLSQYFAVICNNYFSYSIILHTIGDSSDGSNAGIIGGIVAVIVVIIIVIIICIVVYCKKKGTFINARNNQYFTVHITTTCSDTFGYTKETLERYIYMLSHLYT